MAEISPCHRPGRIRLKKQATLEPAFYSNLPLSVSLYGDHQQAVYVIVSSEAVLVMPVILDPRDRQALAF